MCKGKIDVATVCLAILVMTGLACGSVRADVVLMSDLPGKEEPYVSGKKEEADKDFSPASTFKMIIALAAFQKKIAVPSTELYCTDNFIAGARKPLSFQQAMYMSNNDFFRQLIAKLTDEELFDMATKCKFGTPKEGSMKDRDDWIHGGPFRVTPRQEHVFLRDLIQGKLAVDVTCQKELMAVMKWPAVQAGTDVYGKTGSWERTFWFVGVAVQSRKARIETVTLTAPGANRAKAIERFFTSIGRPIPTEEEKSDEKATPGVPSRNIEDPAGVPTMKSTTTSVPMK